MNRHRLVVVVAIALFATILLTQTPALAATTPRDGLANAMGVRYSPLDTFIVNSSGDEIDANENDLLCLTTLNTCTLRAAIMQANFIPAGHNITFNILPGGIQTIQPATALDAIERPMTIDGTTQPGCVAYPCIELNGGSGPSNADGLELEAGNSVVRGLVINQFGADGIYIATGGNVIAGNYIGTDVSGRAARPNSIHGVYIHGGANNIIGGMTAASRNVISGNIEDGILIDGNGGHDNLVRGNYIGTDVTGTEVLGNHAHGVRIDFSARNNVIGGPTAAARNIISANTDTQVVLDDTTSGNSVQGNYIGTDATGSFAIDMGVSDGILISSSGFNAIRANLISGGEDGIVFGDPNAQHNFVQGNLIGTDAGSLNQIGNEGVGVKINSGSFNLVGGINPGEGNVIAFSGAEGVHVLAGTGNTILHNSIHDNSALGIDLDGGGVTANDIGDGDTGPNNLQNFPVIQTAVAASRTITGKLRSTPGTTFSLEFFKSPTCDSSTHGEGQTFIRRKMITTDASGKATFNVIATFAVKDQITATATDPNGNTSEFSACKKAS